MSAVPTKMSVHPTDPPTITLGNENMMCFIRGTEGIVPKEVMDVLQKIETNPMSEFSVYFGCNPSNWPNYGSIHFIHEENDKVLYVQMTNGDFTLSTSMEYNSVQFTEFLQKIISPEFL